MQSALRGPRLPEGAIPSIYDHEVRTGEVWIADVAGEPVGFAGMIRRSGIGFLSEFFVHPRHQSRGIGRQLLTRVLSSGVGRCCTLSSTDPRALSLYVRAGLRPRWPHFLLTGATRQLHGFNASRVQTQEAPADDAAIVEWDARIGGRWRPEDHAFWRSLGAVAAWVKRGGVTIGYGYLRRRPASTGEPASVVIGPVGVAAPDDAVACVEAAVAWGRAHGEMILAALPGPHLALPAMLDAGLHITYIETFVASDGDAFCDPRAYMPGAGLEGSTLF